ncbi:hypothetical protein [Streptomyces sp. NPDC002845]
MTDRQTGKPAKQPCVPTATSNTYWTWHEKQEFTRNHQARYRDQLKLTA